MNFSVQLLHAEKYDNINLSMQYENSK